VKLGLVRTGENGIIYKVSLITAIYYDSKMRKSLLQNDVPLCHNDIGFCNTYKPTHRWKIERETDI
jgi:hypothetical protein